MVLQSRRYELFRRLEEKLLLESGEAAAFPPLVSRELVIVIDATELLLDQDIEQANADLTGAGSGYVITHTVPKGQRWRLVSLNREAATGATHVELRRTVAAINHQLTVNTIAFQIEDVQGITLEAGDTIGLIETNDAGDAAIFLRLIFNREVLGLAQ